MVGIIVIDVSRPVCGTHPPCAEQARRLTQSFRYLPEVVGIDYRISRRGSLNNLVDRSCPLSACGLPGDDSSDVFVNDESLGSCIKSVSGNAERLGEGLPLGKGIAAPPDAACCSMVDWFTTGIVGAGMFTNSPPKITPRRNGIRYGTIREGFFAVS